MASNSSRSIWDLSADEARKLINDNINAIEAEQPEVSAIKDVSVPWEKGTVPVRIYIPNSHHNNPVAIMIHGGAWVGGSLDTHDNMARYFCKNTPTVVISIGYTNSPAGKHPLPLQECYAVLEWATKHAHEFNGNPARLSVVGDSSGGNIVAALCLMSRDKKGPAIKMQILINPAPDLTGKGTLERKNDAEDLLRWQALHYVSDPKDVFDPYVSPTIAPDLSQLPSTLIILAEKDALKEDGQLFADRLLAAGNQTQTYTQLDVDHLAGNGARAAAIALESLNVAVAALQSIDR